MSDAKRERLPADRTAAATTSTTSAGGPSRPSPPAPPVAPREPVESLLHGERRIDDYAWLRERDDPRTLPYLEAENAHAEAWFAPHEPLCEALYQEMLGRIQQADESVPSREGDWWYLSRTLEGQQYPVYLRRRAAGPDRAWDPTAPEQVLLDLNAMARGQAYLALGDATVSPDGDWLAYTTDATGGRDYVLHVKDLVQDRRLDFVVRDVDSVAWSNDSRTLYYVTVDDAKRAYRLWRVRPTAGGAPMLVYEEPDELYSIEIGKTRDHRYLVLEIASQDTTELRVLDARRNDRPLRTLFPRREGVEIEMDHRAGQFYLRLNDRGRHFRIVRVDARRPELARAEELVPERPDVVLDGLDVFAGHMVLTERAGGRLQLRIVDLAHGGDHVLAFDEAAYTVDADDNPEFDTRSFRFSYTSLATPTTIYDIDLVTHARTLRKRQPVQGGYDPADYGTERLLVKAADGVEVPVSLVWRRSLRDGQAGLPQPLLLHGYGSYGIPSDPWFSSSRLSLLDRGVIFAIAHVRGGGELGRPWYEAGKMGAKMTSFTDFVACAEALVAAGWTAPDRLAIEGGSAGGLLVTAATNLRRDLFRAVIADVPFVDVVNTMLDEDLPLTVGEFIEWGNPKVAEEYAWIRAYSPYDNLVAGEYPAMLVRSGINDSQVAYWEPAKYVAKLRTLKTDARPLLLRIDLDVGHGGASGRFDALRERAEETAFLLVELGLAGAPAARPSATPAG